MARPYLNLNPAHTNNSSPGGFWPNPVKEGFHLSNIHPWEVPRKRKPRGSNNDYFYDLTTEDTVMNFREIPEVHNRYALLDPDLKEKTSRERTSSVAIPDCSYRSNSGDTLFETYDDFF